MSTSSNLWATIYKTKDIEITRLCDSLTSHPMWNMINFNRLYHTHRKTLANSYFYKIKKDTLSSRQFSLWIKHKILMYILRTLTNMIPIYF